MNAISPISSAIKVERRKQLVDAASALVPLVREHATAIENARRLPDCVARPMIETGLFRMFQPARFGGLEMDWGVQIDIAAEIGRASGSAAWVHTVVGSHSWQVGMMEPRAQEDVWANDPNALVANAFFNPSTKCVAVDGGYRLNGTWRFASGVDICEWTNLNVLVPQPDGPPEHRFMLVNKSDYAIEDDWFVNGLAGTGSKGLVLSDVFVPAYRTLATAPHRGGPTPGSAANPAPLYRLPMAAVLPFAVAAPAIGIARGVLELIIEQTAPRASIGGAVIARESVTQVRVAQAAAEIDAAAALLRHDAYEIDRMAANNEHPDLATRARYRRDTAYAATACAGAVDRLYTLSGARGLTLGNPVQRHWRDIHAVASHATLTFDVQGQNWGRVALGLDPLDSRI